MEWGVAASDFPPAMCAAHPPVRKWSPGLSGGGTYLGVWGGDSRWPLCI